VGCWTRRNLQHPSQSVGGPRGHAVFVFTDVDALGIHTLKSTTSLYEVKHHQTGVWARDVDGYEKRHNENSSNENKNDIINHELYTQTAAS
jgi:hypothetical protein